ncbi:MAG: RNA polymerase sigma factor [Chloroflexi bacterium]|nr:RNA polymerase sigma factor [Chloroflexota bacterium]
MLFRNHFAQLVTLAAGWLGDRDAAEDVAQAALIAAWETARRGVVLDRPDAWLTRVARNLAVSELRRRVSRAPLPANEPPDDGCGAGATDSAAVVERRDTLDGVLAAILALPPRYRDDLLLHLRAADPVTAATVRGMTRVAWQARLVRAREALRLALATPTVAKTASTIADRRRAVATLQSQGQPPAAIARALGLPRRTVLADLAVARRRSAVSGPAAVVLLRQLLLFGEPPSVVATRRSVIRAAPRRSRQPTGAQLGLPLSTDPSC